MERKKFERREVILSVLASGVCSSGIRIATAESSNSEERSLEFQLPQDAEWEFSARGDIIIRSLGASDNVSIFGFGKKDKPIIFTGDPRRRDGWLGKYISVFGRHIKLLGIQMFECNVYINGASVHLSGLDFQNARAPALVIPREAGDVLIERCRFSECQGMGISIEPPLEPKIFSRKIIECNFHKFRGIAGSNGHEAIQLGQRMADMQRIGSTAIIDCRFYGIRIDPETISIKSSKNLLAWNRFFNSNELVIRGGEENLLLGNCFFYSDGIRVHGLGTILVGNISYRTRLSVRLMHGDLVRTGAKTERIGHHAAERTTIFGTFSELDVRIDRLRNGQNIAPRSNFVVDSGEIWEIEANGRRKISN